MHFHKHYLNKSTLALPEVVSTVQTPLPDAEAARLALDDLGVVVEAVEELPQEDHRHQHQVDAAQDQNVGLQGFGQLLPPVNSLIVLSKMPLIERCLKRIG